MDNIHRDELMTKTQEEKCVVNPLAKFFLDPVRSGARWKIKHKPHYGTSARGWDLQVERKNQVLLIEAKYIRGPFASAMAGLTIAPLVKRIEKMKSNKSQSWAARTCWAIGCGWPIAHGYERDKHNMRRIYQSLFDYCARNVTFWKYYAKSLKLKYVFFIDNKKVAKISFKKVLNLSIRYKSSLGKPQKKRLIIAAELMKELQFR